MFLRVKAKWLSSSLCMLDAQAWLGMEEMSGLNCKGTWWLLFYNLYSEKMLLTHKTLDVMVIIPQHGAKEK